TDLVLILILLRSANSLGLRPAIFPCKWLGFYWIAGSMLVIRGCLDRHRRGMELSWVGYVSLCLRRMRIMRWRRALSWAVVAAVTSLALFGGGVARAGQAANAGAKTRLAVVGLDHDHVWSLLKNIAGEPDA